jgi:sulfur carrier protein
MRIWLNGAETTSTVVTLAELVGPAADGIAVAVNGVVVPRDQRAAHPLAEGDVVEVVHAVAGG